MDNIYGIKLTNSEKNTINSFCVGFLVIMMSGYMWVNINVPELYHEYRGVNYYIDRNDNDQYLMEFFIVMFLIGISSMGFILMLTAADKRIECGNRNPTAVLGLVLFFLSFGVLIEVFKIKLDVYLYSILS